MVKFLSEIGFARFMIEDNKCSEAQFLFKIGNIVEPIIPINIHQVTIDIIESGKIDTKIIPNHIKSELISELMKTGVINKKEVLVSLLLLEKPFISDTKTEANFIYNNSLVTVTKDEISTTSIGEIDNYIWKSQIIKRDFEMCNFEEVSKTSDFYHFLKNVSSVNINGKLENNEIRTKTLLTLIGYLLHTYKDPSNPRAVVFMDSSIKGDPSGRTGKGLIISGVSKLRKTIKEDGKSFKDDDRFKFSLVTPDTDLLFIDDVKENFLFENFFSAISEGIMVEPKFINKFYIPFDLSPKIVISTNYVEKGQGASNNARRYEFDLSNHYSDTRSPRDDFGRMFFTEWDLKQWNLFDSLMIYCVQLYLNEGVIEAKSHTIELKKQIAETSKQFMDWAKNFDFELNFKYSKAKLHTDFIESTNGNSELSQADFTKYLKKFAGFNSWISKEHHSDTENFIVFEQK